MKFGTPFLVYFHLLSIFVFLCLSVTYCKLYVWYFGERYFESFNLFEEFWDGKDVLKDEHYTDLCINALVKS